VASTIPYNRFFVHDNPTTMRMLFLLCAFSLVHAFARAEEGAVVYLSEGELNYVGFTDTDANARLFALYDGLKEKPAVLAIRSRGGDVVPGMELGAWVHANKLNVKVMEFCLSSCANYVFTAGAKKIVSSHAVLGFHGGLSSMTFGVGGSMKKTYDAMTAEQKRAFQEDLKKNQQAMLDDETAFFKTIGVRQDITTYGQQARFAPLTASAGGWTFSQEGFRRFGVDHIEIINGPWKPRLLTIEAQIVTLE
jgi:ATP-dependent protease ClpP protease subunit